MGDKGDHREDAHTALGWVIRGSLLDVDTSVGYASAYNAVTETGAKNRRTILEPLAR